MKGKEKVQVLVFRKRAVPPGTEVSGPKFPLDFEFLILRTNPERGSFWQPVTGGVDEVDKGARDAALRELKEETGITRVKRVLELEYSFEFVKEETDTVFSEQVFAMEVDEDLEPTLSAEHDTFSWVSLSHACEKVSFDSNKKSFLELERILETEEAGKPKTDKNTQEKKQLSLLNTRTVPGKDQPIKLNLPLVALSFSLLLVLGVSLSFFEETPTTSFQGELVIDFNGQISSSLDDSYNLSRGYNIYLWQKDVDSWNRSRIAKSSAREGFGLELGEPEGEYHLIFIFDDLKMDNASVLSLLELCADIGNFSLETTYSGTLDATRVTAIAGVEDRTEGNYWQYWVDEEYATKGADLNHPEGEHTVKWVFK